MERVTDPNGGDEGRGFSAEAAGQTFCGYSQDHKEGVAAFMEKREADFTGK